MLKPVSNNPKAVLSKFTIVRPDQDSSAERGRASTFKVVSVTKFLIDMKELPSNMFEGNLVNQFVSEIDVRTGEVDVG